MARLAILTVLLLALLPAFVRRLPERGGRPCVAEGRGGGARRWLGCAADPGPRRDLAGDERLLLGLPLDVNRASARELAFVPGLSASLAAAVVQERERGGEFGSPDDLLRVHGIGPVRLARARPFVEARRAPVVVAHGGE